MQEGDWERISLEPYRVAALMFYDEAVRSLAFAQSELLPEAPREHIESVPTARYELPDKRLDVGSEPVEVGAAVDVADMRGGKLDELIVAIATMADQLREGLERQLFAHLDSLTAATGLTFDAAGRDFGEVWLEALEAMDYEVDEDGELILPTLVVGSNTEFQALTPEQEVRLTEILDAKREEAIARRPRRRLSGPRF